MKVTVLRRIQGDGKVFYVSAEKDHKGKYNQYTQKEVEGNPIRFYIRESGSFRKASIRESKLPKPLSELNEVMAILKACRPSQSDEKIRAEAEKQVAEKQEYERQRLLTESWQQRGLTPEAARVAARQQISMAPPASDLEFWSKFKL